MKWKPKPYQSHALDFMLEKDNTGLFLDMGLGKTAVALTGVHILMHRMLAVNRTLVIAPKNVTRTVWKQEAAKWDHLKKLKVAIVWGTPEERIAALRSHSDVYVINREMVVWLVGLFQSAFPFDMVIVDESSSFKSHAAKRFTQLQLVRKYISRMVLLSGTPAPNGLMDLWAQMFLLDSGVRLEKNITGYRNRYFVAQTIEGYISKYILRKEAKETIYEKISDVCISMKSEDYLDLPPIVENNIYIEMEPHIRRLYDAFEEEQIMAIAGKEITALSAAALSTKLLQFSNGAMYHSDILPGQRKTYAELHDTKLTALRDVIEQAQGQSVLVLYSYQHDCDRILREFKQAIKLKGEKQIDDWNAGKIDLMVGHPASMGHGLNLQSGGHILVFFGHTWSLELYLQVIKRLHRLGQMHTVVLNRLIMLGTMDEDIIKAVDLKKDGQDALLEAIKVRQIKYGT